MKNLTLKHLKQEAKEFSLLESQHHEASLYGVDNGKSIGTYIEHKFQNYLRSHGYEFKSGNSANGIDLPDINVDIKVTSIRQPQSSCPFRSARQKIYGLGYNILLFVYQKRDDKNTQTSCLIIRKTVFIDKDCTADYQLTSLIRSVLSNHGNVDDLMACLLDRNLPIDEVGAYHLAEEIYQNPPQQGLLTISNALQWRLQYSRVIERSGQEIGLDCLHSNNS
jgi:hypothetical protein